MGCRTRSDVCYYLRSEISYTVAATVASNAIFVCCNLLEPLTLLAYSKTNHHHITPHHNHHHPLPQPGLSSWSVAGRLLRFHIENVCFYNVYNTIYLVYAMVVLTYARRLFVYARWLLVYARCLFLATTLKGKKEP